MVDVGLERAGDVPLAGREPLDAGQRLVARPLELRVVELLGEVGIGVDDADGRGGHAGRSTRPGRAHVGRTAPRAACRRCRRRRGHPARGAYECRAMRSCSDSAGGSSPRCARGSAPDARAALVHAQRRWLAARGRGAGHPAARVQARGRPRRRRDRARLRPGQPEARARRVRREVGARAARLRAAGVAGRGGRAGATPRSRSAAAGSARTSPIRVWSPRERRRGPAAAAAAGQRRAGVRRARLS